MAADQPGAKSPCLAVDSVKCGVNFLDKFVETNQINNQLEDLQQRSTALRGYL